MTAFRAQKQNGDGDGNGPAPNHVVHFYDEREAMLTNAAAHLAGGLLRGAPALAVIASDRVDVLRNKLGQMGVDVARAAAARQLVIHDAEATLAELLVDDMPDERRFRNVIGGAVSALADTWRPLRLYAYGDMVDVLLTRGQRDAALELERLWNELGHREHFSLFCAYDARSFASENDRSTFDAVCGAHESIVPMRPPQRRPLSTRSQA